MKTDYVVTRILIGALLTAGVVAPGARLAADAAWADAGLTSIAWQMNDPGDPPPPPEPPPPPPPPKQCWALFLPAPCPPPR